LAKSFTVVEVQNACDCDLNELDCLKCIDSGSKSDFIFSKTDNLKGTKVIRVPCRENPWFPKSHKDFFLTPNAPLQDQRSLCNDFANIRHFREDAHRFANILLD